MPDPALPEVCINLGVMNHLTQQEYPFARIFFNGAKGNVDGIFHTVTKTKMTRKV